MLKYKIRQQDLGWRRARRYKQWLREKIPTITLVMSPEGKILFAGIDRQVLALHCAAAGIGSYEMVDHRIILGDERLCDRHSLKPSALAPERAESSAEITESYSDGVPVDA